MAILVAGLGLSGQAALRFLLQQGETQLWAYDTRSDLDVSGLQQSFPSVAFAVGDLPKAWQQPSQVVLSPGIDPQSAWVQALQQAGAVVVGEVELFCRSLAADQRVIAITGTNGKSTVTSLVGELLAADGYRVAVGGNLGTPAVDLWLQQPEAEVFVLELSSFQLETTHSLDATSAVVLNISPDHLDRYDDMAQYIAAKAPIYQMTQLAVINRDDAIAASLCPVGVPQVSFGLSSPTQAGALGMICEAGEWLLAQWLTNESAPSVVASTRDLQLMGRHNWSNILAALALCVPFSLRHESVAKVLTAFKGLAHRAQVVRQLAGVRWVNDSKGTNVGATLSALTSLGADAPIVLLAGGQSKGQDFSPLLPALQQYAKALIVFGEDGAMIASSCEGACESYQVADLAEAVRLARRLADVGDVVLLSPACASFDQFRNYEHRGEVFCQLVEALS